MDSSFVTSEVASLIAARFLARGYYDCENPDPNGPKLKISGKHFEYVLNNDYKVYEFRVFKDGSPSGFILISGNRQIQPILCYSLHGNSLRESLTNTLASIHTDIDAKNVNWIYAGPFDIIAEIQNKDGTFTYYRIPNYRRIDSPKRRSFMLTASARAPFLQEWISSRWAYYEGAEGFPIPGLDCSTMWGIVPVDYQQTCRAFADSAVSPSSNYCTPNCIAGCVPVAWGVLASAYKSGAIENSIFSDAPDWKRGWPTYPPQPASERVNSKIWRAHDNMSTTCQGNTTAEHGWPFPANDCLSGQIIFDSYLVHWKWAYNKNVDYSWATEPNRHGQPNILTGKSAWSAGADPADGHAVVCAGFNDNDQHLQISMGWGTGFHRRWVAFSTISEPWTYFVTKFSQRASVIEKIKERFRRSGHRPSAAVTRPNFAPVKDPIAIVPVLRPEAPRILQPSSGLSYRGGPLLTSAQIITIFWGSAWQGAQSALVGQINQFFQYIMASPYIDQMAEYSVSGFKIGHGAFASSQTIVTPGPSASVTDADIQSLIAANFPVAENPTPEHVNAGLYSAYNEPSITHPNPVDNRLYFVFTPPGVGVSNGTGMSCGAGPKDFCGYHSAIGNVRFYAVIPFPNCVGCGSSTLQPFDAITLFASHELAETITDPIPGAGWYNSGLGEIGDFCNQNAKTLNGYTVQKLWSNSQNGCI